MNKLAAEAIADAKALKEMAVANAQLALAESFRDKVEHLVNEKIDSEILEMEDDEDVDSENVDENDDSVDEAESDDSSDDEEDTKADDGEDLDENSEALDEEDDDEEEEDDEDGLGLDEIIAELEASLKKENTKSTIVKEEEADEEVNEEEVNEEDDSEGDEDDDSEEFNLDELLASIGEMDFDHTTEKVNESAKITSLTEKLQTVQTERDEYKEAVIFMKEKLSEVNLLNAKLLYANKLFQAYSMTNEQKVKVIESLDRTNSVHEVKLIYSTLAESLKFGSKPTMRKSSSIMEGLSSAKIGSTAPDEKKIISEATDGNQRLQFLAGIIK